MFLLAFAEESIQLFPDGTLFIHIALILIMIWVLNRTFFKPINNLLQSREKHKGKAGGEAGALLADVAEREGRYSRELLEARSAGYELVEQERGKAVAERQAQVAKVKEETARSLAEQKTELRTQAEAAKATMAVEAEKMADKIAENILKV